MKEKRVEGGREEKMGNPAHAVSMLLAGMYFMYVYLGQPKLYREDIGRMEKQENEKREGGGVERLE